MDEAELRRLLEAVAAGEAPVEEALTRCKTAPFADLGYAKVDTHRGVRQGVAEVVYGEGKTAAQVAGICQALRASGQPRVLVTRLDAEKAAAVADALGAGRVGTSDADVFAGALLAEARAMGAGAGADVAGGERAGTAPDAGAGAAAPAAGGGAAAGVGGAGTSVATPGAGAWRYFPEARLGVVGGMPAPDGAGEVVIAAAGTSDLPVAEEAALTAEFLGNRVTRLYDVGVAGIHRLLAHGDVLARARVVVAVAGMEGALASVVGGLVSCPVIAVPTSVGYGASFGGVTALLAMLNSCASGVSVVNIDNGFGAAYQASLINHLR